MNLAQESSISQGFGYELTAYDEALLLAARAGSHTAFAELQNLYARRVYKRILSMTKNHEDAEDALQETFLNAYRALPSFEGRARFSSWLMRIAVNSALMVLRRRRNHPEVSFEHEASKEGDTPWCEPLDSSPNPEQLCDEHQRCEAVWRAIQRLDPKARHAMNIRIVQGKSIKEAAHNLGVSSASVKTRLHRARKQLAQSPDLRAHSSSPSNRRASTCLRGSLGTHA